MSAPTATSPAEPTPTEAAAIPLPAGAQFARAATSIPGEAVPVVTQFLTRAYFFAIREGHAEALYRESVDWLRTAMDGGTAYRPPAGATLDGPFRPVAAAANDNAMVVLGGSTTTDHHRPAGFDRLPESVIWVTHDGKAFQRIAVRSVVDAEAVRMTGIVVTSHGFVAVGNVLPNGFGDPGGIVVLQSEDGEHWSVGERLEGEGTLYARALHADADRLLVDATDQVCDPRGVTFPSGVRIGPTVAWSSADAGQTWSRVDLYGADSVLVPFGALIEGCPVNPKLGDLIGLSKGLDTEGSIVGFAGGALFTRSRDGTTVGVSTDLETWRQAKLPEASPLAEDARGPYAQAIVLDISGAIRSEGKVALLALEDRPDADGRPKSGGCQVRWWRSEDAGTTWSTGPLARPFTTCAGATWTYDQLLDGSVVLFSNAIMANTNRGEASFRTGTPGQLIAWDTCVPGPKADCSFATITAPAGDGNDWPGINLAGATVTGAKLDAANLEAGVLYAALLSGSFQRADLRKVTASYVVLEGSFKGADFTDAYLFHAAIRADLTGANLAGAELSGATLGEGAVCPDGKAPTAGAGDARAACRL